MSIKMRTRYNYGRTSGITFDQPSMAKQSFKQECDINSIMARYARTGLLGDPIDQIAPQVFADVSDGLDYHAAQQRILEARDAFAALPAALRDRFGNDPATLISWLEDRNNDAEAVKLGLRYYPEGYESDLPNIDPGEVGKDQKTPPTDG